MTIRQLWHRTLSTKALLPATVGIIILTCLYARGWWSNDDEALKAGTNISLPANLEAVTLARFDDMARRGKIIYEETETEVVVHKDFKFDFRIAPMFKKKPIMSGNAPGRSKAEGPFINPDPAEVVASIGTTHRLLLNKFCMYRPMLVLPTMDFARQTDDLDLSDLTAVYAVLRRFKTLQMAIFNCGVNAGSSQGHKHMQVFPRPTSFELWPSRTAHSESMSSDIESVPFKHFVQRIPTDASLRQIEKIHHGLLQASREVLAAANAGSDYNVVMTLDWIALIPRATSGENGTGPYGANAMGMLGMVTVPDEKERQWWADLGYTDYLTKLGIARDDRGGSKGAT